jgi:hypothetical protein
MRYILATVFGTVLLLATAGVSAADDRVTSVGGYTRWWDGGSDAAMAECSSSATAEGGFVKDAAVGEDSDTNDGGQNRQANEPFSIVDPAHPSVVVAGWNDYCLSDFHEGWQGFAYSLNSGATWTDSLVPGYPEDDSFTGSLSPLHGTHTSAGDPIGAFDNEGNLYVGGIAFNRSGPTLGHVWVASFPHENGPDAGKPPFDYARTVIVGVGTPGRQFGGIFEDKPMLEVDRTGGDYDGNVYVCWSRFTGAGQNKAYFSRSTDGGQTFSAPMSISRSRDVRSIQDCDIAVTHNGDVYVSFRTYDDTSPFTATGVAFVKSTDGGRTFSAPRRVATFIAYSPFDGSRDCGDGTEHCPSDFVFARLPLSPRITADQTGDLPGVYVSFNSVEDPVESDTSYSSAGGGRVGQSLIRVVRSVDGGETWSDPVMVDEQEAGQQFFADIDAFRGRLGVMWQDSRDDPSAGNLQVPIGNKLVEDTDGNVRAVNSDPENGDIVNTYFAALVLDDPGFHFGGAVKVSSEPHQPQFEMFGNRSVPFQGDYNWISIAPDGSGGLFAYASWTDNRDVVQGDDQRELDPNADRTTDDGFDDNFDVRQCRVVEEVAAQGPPGSTTTQWGPDTCPNGGGLNQNVYGVGEPVPAAGP